MAPNKQPNTVKHSKAKGNVVKPNSIGYTLESTFPNLKSSGLRGIPFPNIFDWLKGNFLNLMRKVSINYLLLHSQTA